MNLNISINALQTTELQSTSFRSKTQPFQHSVFGTTQEFQELPNRSIFGPHGTDFLFLAQKRQHFLSNRAGFILALRAEFLGPERPHFRPERHHFL